MASAATGPRHLALEGRVWVVARLVVPGSVTWPCPRGGSDAGVAAGWQVHPVSRAHPEKRKFRGCKGQRSGGTTQDKRAPLPSLPARATNPRTGGHRPKKRPLTAGISVGYFVTWQASSSTPHWCPSRCRRTWYDGWWSTTALMSRCSRSWYAYGGGLLGIVTFSVLRSFFVSPHPLRVVRSCAGVDVTSWFLGNVVFDGCSDANAPRASSAVCAEP